MIRFDRYCWLCLSRCNNSRPRSIVATKMGIPSKGDNLTDWFN